MGPRRRIVCGNRGEEGTRWLRRDGIRIEGSTRLRTEDLGVFGSHDEGRFGAICTGFAMSGAQLASESPEVGKLMLGWMGVASYAHNSPRRACAGGLVTSPGYASLM